MMRLASSVEAASSAGAELAAAGAFGAPAGAAASESAAAEAAEDEPAPSAAAAGEAGDGEPPSAVLAALAVGRKLKIDCAYRWAEDARTGIGELRMAGWCARCNSRGVVG